MLQSVRRAAPTNPGIKRYNLVLPQSLFDEIEKLAITRQTTVASLFRQFIKLGLIVSTEPNAVLIIRTEGGSEREIVML